LGITIIRRPRGRDFRRLLQDQANPHSFAGFSAVPGRKPHRMCDCWLETLSMSRLTLKF
jgi:hypothetical protein